MRINLPLLTPIHEMRHSLIVDFKIFLSFFYIKFLVLQLAYVAQKLGITNVRNQERFFQ